MQSRRGGTSVRSFFFFFFSSCFFRKLLFHNSCNGCYRPLLGRRSVAVLTVHGTLRAAGSAPPRSHPRSGRRIPGFRPGSVGRGRYRSGRRAVEPGKRRGASLQPPPACQPCSSLLLLLELSPIRVSAPHSSPSVFCSGRPGKRESLPTRGAGVSNKPVSTLTPLRQRGSQSTDRERKIPVRSLRAPCSGDRSRYRAVRVRIPPSRGRAALAIFRDVQRESQSLLTPESSLFSFFLTTLRKVISHEAAD